MNIDLEKLEKRIHESMTALTASGFIAGNAFAFGNADGILLEKYNGYADLEAERLIDQDTIFRMFSMTKPVTVIAALQLAEQGKLNLDDSVSKYFPGYADPVKIRNLMNMTSGMSYLEPELEKGSNFSDLLSRWEKSYAGPEPWDTVRAARELASIPLCFEPGTEWKYSLSIDVLGAVVEVISGQTLEEYCDCHIFRPLDMSDASWHLKKNDRDRLCKCYAKSGNGFLEQKKHDLRVLNLMELENPCFYSGGAGLLCTLRDYAKFARMLLCGGTVDGRQVIGPDMIRMMSSSQLDGVQQKSFQSFLDRSDQGFLDSCYSYGFGVRKMVRSLMANEPIDGEWGWSGALGAWFAVDPIHQFWFVYLHERMPCDHFRYMPDIYRSVYSCLKHQSS